MPSTDANGIVQVLTGDPIAPIQTLLNGISASISTAITSLKKDVLVKATSLSDANSKRSALAAAGVVGTTASPLLFYRTDTTTLWSWNGTAWAEVGLPGSGWTDVTNKAGSSTTMQVSRQGNLVSIRGQLWNASNGAIPANSTTGNLCRLPAEFRPTQTVDTAVVGRTLGATPADGTMVDLKISTDGWVSVSNKGGAITVALPFTTFAI